MRAWKRAGVKPVEQSPSEPLCLSSPSRILRVTKTASFPLLLQHHCKNRLKTLHLKLHLKSCYKIRHFMSYHSQRILEGLLNYLKCDTDKTVFSHEVTHPIWKQTGDSGIPLTFTCFPHLYSLISYPYIMDFLHVCSVAILLFNILAEYWVSIKVGADNWMSFNHSFHYRLICQSFSWLIV